MLALSLLPLGLFADGASTYRMTGGLFQDFAPSLFHLKHVLLPTVRKMGVEAEVRIIQPGYVPKGGGRIEVQIMPVKEALKPLKLVTPGTGEFDKRNRALLALEREKRIPKNGERM